MFAPGLYFLFGWTPGSGGPSFSWGCFEAFDRLEA